MLIALHLRYTFTIPPLHTITAHLLTSAESKSPFPRKSYRCVNLLLQPVHVSTQPLLRRKSFLTRQQFKFPVPALQPFRHSGVYKNALSAVSRRVLPLQSPASSSSPLEQVYNHALPSIYLLGACSFFDTQLNSSTIFFPFVPFPPNLMNPFTISFPPAALKLQRSIIHFLKFVSSHVSL